MRHSPRSKRVITKRDERLFHYLYLNKVASTEQIRRDVFDNKARQVVHRRLSKLIDVNYLEVTYLREKGNRTVYSLSKKAFKEHIGEKKELKRQQRKSQSIHHDLALVDIRQKLLSCSMVKSYFTENALLGGIFDDNPIVKAIREQNPDAIIEITTDEESIFLPLEFERSTKFSHRYNKLISRYYLNKEVQAVLFISERESIQKKVMQTEKRIVKNGEPKFFYITLGEVLSGEERSHFKNIKKEVLTMS